MSTDAEPPVLLESSICVYQLFPLVFDDLGLIRGRWGTLRGFVRKRLRVRSGRHGQAS
jgi:hypothetical protein